MNNHWKNFEGYTQVKNETRLISVLNHYDLSFKELKQSFYMFGPHSQKENYKKSGPLRECITIHLGDNLSPKQLLSNIEHPSNKEYKLPETIKFLNSLKTILDVNNERKIGRSYVTILQPGKRIYPHSDTDGEYWSKIERFQFYYSGNSNVSQIIGGSTFEISPGYFYFFDHRQIHEYYNNSSEDVYLLVFDLFKV